MVSGKNDKLGKHLPKEFHPPRCCAMKRDGTPCQARAIIGATVCRAHGGRTRAVQRLAEQRLADLIDPDRALREIARVAYSDLRELFDDKDELLPPKKWSAGAAAAVQSIDVVKGNVTRGDGKGDTIVKIRFWDKMKGLEVIAKHLNLAPDRHEHSGPGGGPVQFAAVSDQDLIAKVDEMLAKARERLALPPSERPPFPKASDPLPDEVVDVTSVPVEDDEEES